MFNSSLINDGRPYGLGIIAAYPLNSGLYDDNGRMSPMIKVGAVAFEGSGLKPMTGAVWAGPFVTAVTYFRTPTDVNVAMQGLNQWTLHWDNVAIPVSASNDTLWTLNNSSNYVMDRGVANGMRFYGADLIFLSTTTAFTQGVSHKLTVTWDGVYRKMYVDDVLRATDTTTGKMPASIVNQWFGSYQGFANVWGGYMSAVRFYNVAKVPPFT